MKLEYHLEENDFLQYQLYTASKTKRIKNQQTKSWLIITALILGLSFLFYVKNDNFSFVYFLIFGIITLIFYPFYSKIHHKKHYQNFVRDTFSKRSKEKSIIQFLENEVLMHDSISESKFNYLAFDEFIEIGDYFFLKLKGAGVIIIPKAKVDDLKSLTVLLTNIATNHEINHKVELNWKW